MSLNAKEQQRAMVLNQVERRELTGQQAAVLVGLSLRQVRRLLARYRGEGVAALAHGNRGRAPVHRTAEQTRERVVELAQGPYKGLNHYHLQEMLAEREELVLSRSSLWRILAGARVASPRQRRAPQHRRRRERYPQEGMLLQVDGSRHDWLQRAGSLPEPGGSHRRCHGHRSLRPLPAAGGCPRLPLTLAGDHPWQRYAAGPLQRPPQHLPGQSPAGREPGGPTGRGAQAHHPGGPGLTGVGCPVDCGPVPPGQRAHRNGCGAPSRTA